MGLAASPNSDQLEITLIGPGFGESIVIHVGNGRWIVVDSCIDNRSQSREPAAIEYLKAIGVSPEQSVVLVAATHWHDDHIRGMARLLDICSKADFCSSAALGHDEFVAMVTAYDKKLFSQSTSGVREIHEVFRVLQQREKSSRKAVCDKAVYFLSGAASGHGHDCRVTTLSPSDKQIDKFYYEIAALMPQIRHTKERCTPQGPNHLAVVIWVEIGPISLLLGADLEETNDAGTGWSVIVSSDTRPQTKATIFKVPHHGSANGHNSDVWQQMLVPAPFAVLTPYNRGSKLPTKEDIERIEAFTSKAYSTSGLKPQKSRKRNPAVDKTLRQFNFVISETEPPTGLVRLRNGGASSFDVWNVELLNGARPLGAVHT